MIIVAIEKLKGDLSLAILCLCLEIVSRGELLLISNKVFEPGFDPSFVEKPARKSAF